MGISSVPAGMVRERGKRTGILFAPVSTMSRIKKNMDTVSADSSSQRIGKMGTSPFGRSPSAARKSCTINYSHQLLRRGLQLPEPEETMRRPGGYSPMAFIAVIFNSRNLRASSLCGSISSEAEKSFAALSYSPIAKKAIPRCRYTMA